MTTEEALKIFTIDEIDSLTIDNLKTIKKEFLLEFQLTDQPVVDFNGHSLDKNGVIEIFEFLNLSLEKHLEKHKTAIIDTFLESGDLTYLLNEGIGKRIVKGIVSLPHKRDKLIFKLAEIIADILINPDANREKSLVQIQKITSELPLDYEEKAYATSFRYLRNEIESIKARYDNPFYDNFSLRLEPELQTMVDVRFLKLFQLLPEKFHFLAYEYSLWCYEFVIKLTQNREKNYAKYPIDSLIVIRNAALIASEYYEENENLKLSSLITTLLAHPERLVKNDKTKNNQKKKREITGRSKGDNSSLQIFGVFAFVLLAFLWLSIGVNSSSKNTDRVFLPPVNISMPLKKDTPKYLYDLKSDSSFRYIGSEGRRMTFSASKDSSTKKELKEVVMAKVDIDLKNRSFSILGDFEEMTNFNVINMNGDTLIRSSQPYKEGALVLPSNFYKGSYLIRGETKNGPVCIEMFLKR